MAIILHQEKLHLLERKREREMNALRLSLLEKETRGKKLVQFTHEPLRCLFSVSSFFFEGKTHAMRALVPLFQLHLSIFCLFLLLLLFAVFFYVIWELEKFKFNKM